VWTSFLFCFVFFLFCFVFCFLFCLFVCLFVCLFLGVWMLLTGSGGEVPPEVKQRLKQLWCFRCIVE